MIKSTIVNNKEYICKLHPPATCEFISFIAEQYQACLCIDLEGNPCPYRSVIK